MIPCLTRGLLNPKFVASLSLNVVTKCYFSSNDSFYKKEVQKLKKEYRKYTHACFHMEKSPSIDQHGVFANGEVDLGKIDVWGFDYDYTLATYTIAVNQFIFDNSRSYMIEYLEYPIDLYQSKFNPHFSIRGLHYDVKKGLLMKVDAYHNVELDCVFKGLQLLTSEEAAKEFHGPHIPKSAFKNNKQLAQLMDFFIIPEMNLLAIIIDYFHRNNIKYVPEYVHADVSRAVRSVHKSGLLHREVADNPTKYIHFDPDLSVFLRRLKRYNKTVFLLTNSGARFICKGMEYLVGPDWKELFDVIIVSSGKPAFFQSASTPFRPSSIRGKFSRWQNVSKFYQGEIYEGGNFEDLKRLTGWDPSSVMYFGDHVYSDLADLASHEGWSTGCIVPELENEISVMNSNHFCSNLHRLDKLERMIASNQNVRSPEAKKIIKCWLDERKILRSECKRYFNSYFGSIFRTIDNPSHFAERLCQYAAIYTSSVTNFLKYNIDHRIFPNRNVLPHEHRDLLN